MCSCEDNPPEVYREVTRKAAKEHRCYECGGAIAKGDLYRIASGIWDGEPSSYKWCHDCATIANLASGLWGDFCWTFGSLVECVSEAMREAA